MNRVGLGIAAASCVALASCMGVPMPGMSGPSASSQQAMMDQGNQLQASMAAAQANVNRPGDEAMTCAALQTELVTTMQDPAVQAHMASAGTSAQAAKTSIRKTQMKMTGMMAASMATGLIASFVPGGGFVAMAQQAATQRVAQGDAAGQQQSMMQMMSSMSEIMPQMMRAQRVMQLAKPKNCEFVKGIDVPQTPMMMPR